MNTVSHHSTILLAALAGLSSMLSCKAHLQKTSSARAIEVTATVAGESYLMVMYKTHSGSAACLGKTLLYADENTNADPRAPATNERPVDDGQIPTRSGSSASVMTLALPWSEFIDIPNREGDPDGRLKGFIDKVSVDANIAGSESDRSVFQVFEKYMTLAHRRLCEFDPVAAQDSSGIGLVGTLYPEVYARTNWPSETHANAFYSINVLAQFLTFDRNTQQEYWSIYYAFPLYAGTNYLPLKIEGNTVMARAVYQTWGIRLPNGATGKSRQKDGTYTSGELEKGDSANTNLIDQGNGKVWLNYGPRHPVRIGI